VTVVARAGHVPVMDEARDVYIGTCWRTPAGWRAAALNRVEVTGGEGWNGAAYETEAAAVAALRREDERRFGPFNEKG